MAIEDESKVKPEGAGEETGASEGSAASTEDEQQKEESEAPRAEGEGGESAPSEPEKAPDVAAAKAEASEAQQAYAKVKGAKWAEPIAAFEQRWTWLESRLLVFVLLWQLISLVTWVVLSGISAPPSTGDASGTAFRGVIAALILGTSAWFASKKLTIEKRQMLVIAGIAVGVIVGLVIRPPAGATSGLRFAVNHALGLDRFDAFLVSYFGNLKGWLQEGSTLTLMGGLRGLATRLTLWLALLGASLATAAGKHIHIDVIFRFLPKRLRVPAAIINYCAAALVCFGGVWGFVDHLAIESFGAKAEDSAGAKISRTLHHIGAHAHLTRKQIGLDLRTLPNVLGGGRYDTWMSAAEWNAWVKDAGFEGDYTPEQIASITVPADAGPHPPLVMSPSGDTTRGILVHDLSLVFPFGLLVIGLRFLLRAILTVSGHIPIDPDAAHREDIPGASTEPAKEGGV